MIGPFGRVEMNETPRQIGPYRILGRIGTGGMGVVYRAQRTDSGETLALKLMRSDLAEDSTFVRRFHREADIARKLSSPNVVKLLDVGDQNGVPTW